VRGDRAVALRIGCVDPRRDVVASVYRLVNGSIAPTAAGGAGGGAGVAASDRRYRRSDREEAEDLAKRAELQRQEELRQKVLSIAGARPGVSPVRARKLASERAAAMAASGSSLAPGMAAGAAGEEPLSASALLGSTTGSLSATLSGTGTGGRVSALLVGWGANDCLRRRLDPQSCPPSGFAAARIQCPTLASQARKAITCVHQYALSDKQRKGLRRLERSLGRSAAKAGGGAGSGLGTVTAAHHAPSSVPTSPAAAGSSAAGDVLSPMQAHMQDGPLSLYDSVMALNFGTVGATGSIPAAAHRSAQSLHATASAQSHLSMSATGPYALEYERPVPKPIDVYAMPGSIVFNNGTYPGGAGGDGTGMAADDAVGMTKLNPARAAAATTSNFVDCDQLLSFVFPPGSYHSSSVGRLLLLALYGPLTRDGYLRGGRGGVRLLAGWEIDSMVEELEREDIIRVFGRGSWVKTLVGDPERGPALLENAVRAATRYKLPSITRESVLTLLSHLPRDSFGRIAFQDVQNKVLGAREERALDMKKTLESDKLRGPKTGVDGRPVFSEPRSPMGRGKVEATLTAVRQAELLGVTLPVGFSTINSLGVPHELTEAVVNRATALVTSAASAIHGANRRPDGVTSAGRDMAVSNNKLAATVTDINRPGSSVGFRFSGRPASGTLLSQATWSEYGLSALRMQRALSLTNVKAAAAEQGTARATDPFSASNSFGGAGSRSKSLGMQKNRRGPHAGSNDFRPTAATGVGASLADSIEALLDSAEFEGRMRHAATKDITAVSVLAASASNQPRPAHTAAVWDSKNKMAPVEASKMLERLQTKYAMSLGIESVHNPRAAEAVRASAVILRHTESRDPALVGEQPKPNFETISSFALYPQPGSGIAGSIPRTMHELATADIAAART
jgi:hypothetical protein